MKLKKIIPFFIAILALVASCTDEATVTLLDTIQVSSSYVSLPVEGGSTAITITAKDSWTVEKVTTTKNPVAWLTISSTSGSAGESTLTFSATSAIDGRTAEVLIHIGTETQRINVIQGLATIASATCAEVIAGPDSKTYQVTGVCTSISNTTYGNWYLADGTGSVYIYGTLDAKGAEKNFMSLGLEVGDEVTVQGPKTTYGTTVELVNVTVIKIKKSLVKVDSLETTVIPIEGGEFKAYLTCKGQGVSVEIPDDANSWLSISSIESAGTNTVVKFKAAANIGGDRGTTLTFRTTDGSKNYSSQATLSQKGAIVEGSIANFIAAANKTTQYRLKGVVSRITDAAKGRFYIKDFSGEVYVYNMSGFQNLGVKVGDIITLVGKYDVYNGTHEVVSAVSESFIPVSTATVAEVLTKPDNANTYYMVTGTIESITSADYGNLILKDGDSQITVYGCYPGYGATGNDRKGLIAAKGLKVGDTLTLIGPKITYGTTIELSPTFYFSHVSAQ